MAFFATVSSLAIIASCRSLLPRSFSSSRVSFAVWLVLRSLSGLLCSFGLAPFSFWFGRSFHLSRVFCYLSLSFPWLFHSVFFRAPLLSVLPLGCSCGVGILGALCLPPFCTFSSFVFFCLHRFFLLYRLPVLFLVLPLSLWFRSCSSPALSYSSVPCRQVLRMCLQFRLRLGRVILIHFTLLCLLHLELRSGFHLFLPFLVILFFLGFCPQCFPVLCVGCGFLLFHYSVYFLLSF